MNKGTRIMAIIMAAVMLLGIVASLVTPLLF
jgi:hypothetical protein